MPGGWRTPPSCGCHRRCRRECRSGPRRVRLHPERRPPRGARYPPPDGPPPPRPPPWTPSPPPPHAPPNHAYAAPAEAAAVGAAAEGRQARAYHVRRAPDAAAARQAALDLLPEGAEVFTASSVTADAVGLSQETNGSGRYTATRPQLMAMDPATQMSEMRRLGAAPQWVVGSVHALTRDGDLVIASASGSQLASMAYGAQNVLFIIGAQKIVPDNRSQGPDAARRRRRGPHPRRARRRAA